MTNEELLKMSFGERVRPKINFNDYDVVLGYYCNCLDELKTTIQNYLTLLTTDFDKGCNLRAFNAECEINYGIKLANKMKQDIINMGYELPLEVIEKETELKEWYGQIPDGIITEVIL